MEARVKESGETSSYPTGTRTGGGSGLSPSSHTAPGSRNGVWNLGRRRRSSAASFAKMVDPLELTSANFKLGSTHESERYNKFV